MLNYESAEKSSLSFKLYSALIKTNKKMPLEKAFRLLLPNKRLLRYAKEDWGLSY